MAHVNTILSQMLQLIPRQVFEHIVDAQAWLGPKPRKVTYGAQFVAMLYAQFSGRERISSPTSSRGARDTRQPEKLSNYMSWVIPDLQGVQNLVQIGEGVDLTSPLPVLNFSS
jgi:hypothetical protein